MSNWKISALAPRTVIEAALVAHEDMWDWDADIILSGTEVADDRPEEWCLEAWLPRKPSKTDRTAIAALFSGKVPDLLIEELPDVDWVTESQQTVEPIRAGKFHIHTPHYSAVSEPGIRDFVIPASQAFGTGQHATTAGCLAMLSRMKASGMVVKNLADIGTGTGLLAFAAMHLWPRALATASDIDAACLSVVDYNMAENLIAAGHRAGELTMIVAEGMDHPLLQMRGPYDLIIANILAGPLIELAPDFAKALIPGGSLVLAGLLATQEVAVRKACFSAGLRIAQREQRGDWVILWLRRRAVRQTI